MDQRAFVKGASAYTECKHELRNKAQELLWQHKPTRPPYDPFLIARLMRVHVEIEPISGLDGYIEVVNGRYFAVISSLTNEKRQRFTLAHELGHVHFMREAEKGTPVPLVRYRANGCPPGLHQDPVEESLCNEFASELLLPTSDVRAEVIASTDLIATALRLSEGFCVSLQAAAKRVVRILGTKRVGCALWKNSDRKLWPMPLWCEGIRTNFRGQLLQMEALITRSADARAESGQFFQCFGKSHIEAEVRVRPLGKNYSFVVAMATKRKRRTDNEALIERMRSQSRQIQCQLSLFNLGDREKQNQNGQRR